MEGCPKCGKDDLEVIENLVDFGAFPGMDSPNRTVCYTCKMTDRGVILTGRAPDKEIEKGTLLASIPFVNMGGHQLVVKDIKYRPHKGAMNHLHHWTANCKEYEEV